MPHPLALFSLAPIGERARDVVMNPSNKHLVSELQREEGGEVELVLSIGHVGSLSSKTTLATLGRTGDVFVEGSGISKIQCSFEIDYITKVVMFYDRSHGLTTQVFGEKCTPFEYGRARKVVVNQTFNTIIGMGGVHRDHVQFELVWHTDDSAQTIDHLRRRETIILEENPRLARTIYAADTVLQSQRDTRIHTPGPRQPTLRFQLFDNLGAGQFGEVFKAINLDSGTFIAVKILKKPAAASEEWRMCLRSLKREVENLATVNHPHIVDYIGSEDWDGLEPKIFMGLKEGTLYSLIKGESFTSLDDLSLSVFNHMLQALDYLASKGMVHRDLKPENILYVVDKDGQYNFQLGDFGFSNYANMAATYVGSPLYMAPELGSGGEQTHKLDVWSLYVTMLWTLDTCGFREKSKHFKGPKAAQDTILRIAAEEATVCRISPMARINPKERASAAQMLLDYFEGVGLSTPRTAIPPLLNDPPRPSDEAPTTVNATTIMPAQPTIPVQGPITQREQIPLIRRMTERPAAPRLALPWFASPRPASPGHIDRAGRGYLRAGGSQRNANQAANQSRINKPRTRQPRLRQPFSPATENRIERMIRPRVLTGFQIPGAFPLETDDAAGEPSKIPFFT
ncbi:kinase-like protein [Xylaria sp. FL1042]|nr:kinase-like protein [Xylaria sp. FL1042]